MMEEMLTASPARVPASESGICTASSPARVERVTIFRRSFFSFFRNRLGCSRVLYELFALT